MYIKNKYWDNYIGDTDDSLTLMEYLAGKQKEEISVGEIFSDFGLDKLGGSFRKPNLPLSYENPDGEEIDIHYAITLITDLAALLLECKKNESVNLFELSDGITGDEDTPAIRIKAAQEDNELINKAISDFATAPLAYDLSEMVPEDDMIHMSLICEKMRKELYG